MTVVPFHGAGLEAAPVLASARRVVRGVSAAGARLRLVRPGPLEGVTDSALVLRGRLPGAVVAPRQEVACHG
jgi:hypothetical protein